jgi:hypothetical protein
MLVAGNKPFLRVVTEQDVPKKGMDQKAREFVKRGAELYTKT